jgi:hypothetical protein
MEIGVYICLGGFFYLLGLLFLARPTKKVVLYTLLSLVMGCLTFVAFYGLSYLMGVMHHGQVYTYSYPQEYFWRGIPGWVAMLLLPLGIVSPLLAAFMIARQDGIKA